MLVRLLALTATLALGIPAGATAATDHPGPKLFSPGVISSPDQEEYRITFTPDGRTAYFSRAASFFPVSRQATIYQAHRTPFGWSEPVVASFSGTYSSGR